MHRAGGSASGRGCPADELLKGIVAISGIGHGVPCDGSRAIPGIVGKGKDLAGPRIGDDIAARVVGVAPERCAILGHAGDPVGDRVIGGKPGRGDTSHRVDVGAAVAHAVIETAIALKTWQTLFTRGGYPAMIQPVMVE